MRKMTSNEKSLGVALLTTFMIGLVLVSRVRQMTRRPFAIRNESGRSVEFVPMGTSRDRFESVMAVSKQTPIIRLANGGHTELEYDFDGVNFCWLVVFAEGGDARVVKTPLTGSKPNACAIEAKYGWPCCNPLPGGQEFVISQLRELEPVPQPLLQAADLHRNP